jgi:hypothetical protein
MRIEYHTMNPAAAANKKTCQSPKRRFLPALPVGNIVSVITTEHWFHRSDWFPPCDRFFCAIFALTCMAAFVSDLRRRYVEERLFQEQEAAGKKA